MARGGSALAWDSPPSWLRRLWVLSRRAPRPEDPRLGREEGPAGAGLPESPGNRLSLVALARSERFRGKRKRKRRGSVDPPTSQRARPDYFGGGSGVQIRGSGGQTSCSTFSVMHNVPPPSRASSCGIHLSRLPCPSLRAGLFGHLSPGRSAPRRLAPGCEASRRGYWRPLAGVAKGRGRRLRAERSALSGVAILCPRQREARRGDAAGGTANRGLTPGRRSPHWGNESGLEG